LEHSFNDRENDSAKLSNFVVDCIDDRDKAGDPDSNPSCDDDGFDDDSDEESV
jgi:hypothetical protein